MENTTTHKSNQLAISLFLSLSIHQVMLNKENMTTIDYDFLINQICDSIHILFPEPFEA